MRNIVLIIFLVLISCSSVAVIPPSTDQKNAERQTEKAKKAFARGEVDKAFEFVDESIRIATAYNFPDARVNALLMKSKMYLETRKFDKSEAVLKDARKIAEHDAIELLPCIMLSEAVLAWEQGDRKKPISILDKIGKMPDELEPGVLNFRSRIMYAVGNTKEALEYAEKASKKSDDTGNFYEKAMALKNAAVVYAAGGRYQEAIEKIKETLEIDRKLGSIKSILWDMETLGNLYIRIGNKEKGSYYLNQGMEVSNGMSDMARKMYLLDNSLELPK
jgi:tetratricopeptide (TPR) repeat protein